MVGAGLRRGNEGRIVANRFGPAGVWSGTAAGAETMRRAATCRARRRGCAGWRDWRVGSVTGQSRVCCHRKSGRSNRRRNLPVSILENSFDPHSAGLADFLVVFPYNLLHQSPLSPGQVTILGSAFGPPGWTHRVSGKFSGHCPALCFFSLRCWILSVEFHGLSATSTALRPVFKVSPSCAWDKRSRVSAIPNAARCSRTVSTTGTAFEPAIS